MFLPPYSPDYNLIELAFSKLKALFRKAAGPAIDGFWDAIGRILDTFSPSQCRTYFKGELYTRVPLLPRSDSPVLGPPRRPDPRRFASI